jgi:hypothetical protein
MPTRCRLKPDFLVDARMMGTSRDGWYDVDILPKPQPMKALVLDSTFFSDRISPSQQVFVFDIAAALSHVLIDLTSCQRHAAGSP